MTQLVDDGFALNDDVHVGCADISLLEDGRAGGIGALFGIGEQLGDFGGGHAMEGLDVLGELAQ